MTKQFNVLFLSVDALRSDRTSLHGYKRPTTPVLERLAKNSLVCDQAVSLAAFTQASFPALLTSSRPLSYGGFDNGGYGRPKTVFQVFSESGYDVSLLCSFKWISRFFGYTEGIDRETHLFGPNDLVGAAVNRMKSSLLGYHAGTVSSHDMLAVAEPVINGLFDQLDGFCIERMQQFSADRADFGNTSLIRAGYNFKAIRKIVSKNRREFQRDPAAYVDRHLYYVPKSHQWISKQWSYKRHLSALLEHGLIKATNMFIRPFNDGLALLRKNRFKQFVDGAALANRVIRTFSEHSSDKPFFIWTHFLDTHVPYLPGNGPRWYECAGRYLKKLNYSDTINPATALRGAPKTDKGWQEWGALYDAAVLYVDEQIGRILDALKEQGLSENTLVVICGDHGEELGEHGNISHYFRLHENNVRVPMLFFVPGAEEKRIDSLVSLLDLAPTLAELCNISPAPEWEGLPVTFPAVKDRRHMVLETFYGGNCLFDKRPLYMAVRTHKWKYLWKEYMDPDDTFGPDGNELYDLETDPLEQKNLYYPDHPVVDELNATIALRLEEIHEIPRDRIDAAFGAHWRVARAAS